MLDITTPEGARKAAAQVIERARAARPNANIEGVTIHPMIRRPNARELIAGVGEDPTFGPVILFGRGGTAAWRTGLDAAQSAQSSRMPVHAT